VGALAGDVAGGLPLAVHGVGGAGTAHGLAVESGQALTGQLPDPDGHPGAHPRVQVVGVQQGLRPADRGFRRQHLICADTRAGQGIPIRVLDPR
jgi:hypothetical protein